MRRGSNLQPAGPEVYSGQHAARCRQCCGKKLARYNQRRVPVGPRWACHETPLANTSGVEVGGDGRVHALRNRDGLEPSVGHAVARRTGYQVECGCVRRRCLVCVASCYRSTVAPVVLATRDGINGHAQIRDDSNGVLPKLMAERRHLAEDRISAQLEAFSSTVGVSYWRTPDPNRLSLVARPPPYPPRPLPEVRLQPYRQRQRAVP